MSELYLNIGCGRELFDGFINIDLEEGADLQLDVTEGLPYSDGSVKGIYSEHFIEHLSQGDGFAFLRECRRVLTPGGIVRLATPDLDQIIARYGTEDWLGSGMRRHGYDWVDNPCEMMNLTMRSWGHQWVYNETELVRLCTMAGLEVIARKDINDSEDPMLSNRETRPESLLIIEVRKPRAIPADEVNASLVSVLIPAFREEFFREALESALAQTHPNIEIIIGDDSGSYEIESIAAEYDDPRIRYYKNSENIGGRENILKLASLAKGEYIKFLNDDDLLEPTCVARLLDGFAQNPSVTIATSHRGCIYANGKPAKAIAETECLLPESGVIQGASLAQVVIGSGVNFIGEPTTMMYRRRDALAVRPNFLSVGGAEARGIGDVAVAMNMLMKGDCYYIVDTLSYFRLHENQLQRRPEIRGRALESWDKLRYQGNRLGFFDPQGGRDLIYRDRDGEWRSQGITFLTPTPDRYQEWRHNTSLKEVDGQLMAERMVSKWRAEPSIHLLLILESHQENWLADTLDSLVPQLYKGWGLSIISPLTQPDGGFEQNDRLEWVQVEGDIPQTVNRVITETGAEWVAVLSPGDRLEPHALFKFADYINLRTHWMYIYCDEDRVGDDGQFVDPRFKPDINMALLRSQAYVGGLSLIRRQVLEAVGGFSGDPLWFNYDACLRVTEQFGEDSIGHIRDVLMHRLPSLDALAQEEASERAAISVLEGHMERMGRTATVSRGLLPATFRVRSSLDGLPKVSIIILSNDADGRLKTCLGQLFKATEYSNYEVVVVSHGAALNDTKKAELGGSNSSRVRWLNFEGSYQYGVMNNLAAEHAQGEYLLFLHHDALVVQEDWLERMVARAQQDEVGAVGARLLWPNQNLQHCGYVLGLDNGVGSLFDGLDINNSGYMNRAACDQYFEAVSGACMLTSRGDFDSVGGFSSDAFNEFFGDVDYCLRLGDVGKKILWTADVTVIHEADTLRLVRAGEGDWRKRKAAAYDELYSRWLDHLGDDKNYNPNLSLIESDARVESEVLAGWDTNYHERARVIGFPLDELGCGVYRVYAPLRGLEKAAAIQATMMPSHDGVVDPRMPSLCEIERLQPDSLLLQSVVKDGQLARLREYKRFTSVFKVSDLDDLKTNLPEKSSRRATMFPDIKRRLRDGLALSDRLIVSTEPLRDAFQDQIDDIVIIPNYLEQERWLSLESKRGQGRKPRVGWAGAQQHHGDLEFISEVVKQTANEVDWVFFGMCLDELRPYVKEIHGFVSFSDYPAKLASLNLDLAVAPLEIHPFNEAKSNLRLLEYGVFGWPVVCTDIFPYQNAPVKRVANDTQAWITAIRERVNDLDNTYREGDVLRQWVYDNWILENNLEPWMRALLP